MLLELLKDWLSEKLEDGVARGVDRGSGNAIGMCACLVFFTCSSKTGVCSR